MTHLALLTVRNEAAFLLEWLAHHRAVGFDDFRYFIGCEFGDLCKVVKLFYFRLWAVKVEIICERFLFILFLIF